MTKPVRTYPCPAGCGEQVPENMYACRTDWNRLPKRIRERIWSTYKSDSLLNLFGAIKEAESWYEQNPRTVS